MYKVNIDVLKDIKNTLTNLSLYLNDEDISYETSTKKDKKNHIWNDVKKAKKLVKLIEENYYV